MTVRAETQIDLARVDDGAAGQNGATFTPSVDAAGDISWTNDGGLPNPQTRNIKGPAGNTPYIQGGYWYINGTSTGVKAEGEDGTTSVWYYGNKITGTSTTATVFSGSGIANAVVGDMYLNTDNSNVYQCTLGGNASTAKWVYAGTIADGIITVKSVNGSIASFADASEYPAIEVITDIDPKQNLNGYANPWVGGAGKNKLPWDLATIKSANTSGTWNNNVYTLNTLTFTVNNNGAVTINGTASANTNFYFHKALSSHLINGTSYTLSGCPVGGSSSTYRIALQGFSYDTGSGATGTATTTTNNCWIQVFSGYNASNLVVKPMIRLATDTDSSYAPYENICPISGSTEVNTYVNTTHTTTGADTYTTPLPSTVYGGTLDVTKGLLTVTHGIVDLSTLSWTYSSNYSATGRAVFYASLSDSLGATTSQVADCVAENYETASTSTVTTTAGGKISIANNSNPPRVWCSTLAQATTPTGNLVYELATSQTYNVSPQQIQLLQGTNCVWTDSADVDVKYAIISASAVEALREPIDNASKVATSYITQIDEGGIKVHDAGDTTNYAKLDSNGMQIYQGGTQVANFDSDSVDLGMNGVSSEITLCDSAGIISAWRANSLNALNIFSVPPSATYPYSRVHITPQTRGSNGTYHEYAWCDLESGTGGGSISFTVEDPNDFYNGEKLEFKAGYPLKLFCNGYSENQAQFHIDDGSTEVWIGLGADGTAHGVYSETNGAWIAFSDGTYNYTDDNFGPWITSTSTSTGYYLGWSAKRWRQLYSYSAVNTSSDRKQKDVIGDIDFAKELIMGLEPVEFQWKDSDHKRSHMGFIAQDSAEVAKAIGKDLSFYEAHYQDGSDYHGEKADDKDLSWGMMYSELIAPLVKVVQEQQKEIDELKSIVAELAKEKK